MTLINYSIGIRDADVITDAMINYFTCQASGYSADHTCSAEYDKLRSHLHPELQIIVYFFLGFLPFLNLLFAVQVSDIKKALQKILYLLLYGSRGSPLSTSADSNQQHS